MADREKAVADWGKSGNCSSKRAQKRWQTGNEGEVGCQPRNTANLPHVVMVSCGKTGCLLGSKSGQSEKEGNSRKKREIDGKAVKTSSRVTSDMFALPCRMVTHHLISVRYIVLQFPNVFPLLHFPVSRVVSPHNISCCVFLELIFSLSFSNV